MRLRKIGVLVAVVGFALVGVSLFGFTPKNQISTAPEYGPVVNGLQLSLSLDRSSKDGLPNFIIALHNVGKNDVIVNLGTIMGPFQSPDALHLLVKDDAGNIKELDFGDTRYSGVAGRLDNYVVPLRIGSTYSLPLPYNQFWSPKMKELPFKLSPGKYQATASFEGDGYKYHNSGDEWNAYANFIWKGKLQSNTISFEQ